MMTRMKAKELDRHTAIHLAAARTEADTRTIAKVLDGLPVRGRVGERIRKALVEIGVKPPDITHVARSA